MNKAKKWIDKKLAEGVSREKLRSCVGAFSNRKKKTVMAEKKLTEKQYRERYEFLSKVYSLL